MFASKFIDQSQLLIAIKTIGIDAIDFDRHSKRVDIRLCDGNEYWTTADQESSDDIFINGVKIVHEKEGEDISDNDEDDFGFGGDWWKK